MRHASIEAILGCGMAILDPFFEISSSNLFCPSFQFFYVLAIISKRAFRKTSLLEFFDSLRCLIFFDGDFNMCYEIGLGIDLCREPDI